jgi:type IV secretion system protein VirB11
MLRMALGPAIARFLEDPAIVEVIFNPNGPLWVDRLTVDCERFSASAARRQLPCSPSTIAGADNEDREPSPAFALTLGGTG